MAARKTGAPKPPALVLGSAEPPEGLLEAGRATWSDTWQAVPWLTEADAPVVRMLAEGDDERAGLRALVLSDAGTWRDRVALRQLDAQQARILGHLGMNPTARRRLDATAPAGLTVLDEIRARRR